MEPSVARSGGALPLRPAGGHGRARSSAGPRPSAPRSHATPGPRASRATGRCTSHTADSVWAFELGQQARRDRRAARRAARCASRPARCPERRCRATPEPASPSARRTSERGAAIAGAIGDETLRKRVQKAVELGARERPGRPPDLIHFRSLAKPAFCRHFLSYGKDPGEGRILGQGHHGARRARARPPAPGHVHRLDGRRAGSTTWSTRSSTTPSTRRSRATTTRRGHDPPRQLGHGRRPRPRHPGRRDPGAAALGARGDPDEAPRRRQVRRRRLQGLRRPARRRRLGRERALRVARRRGRARRQGLPAGVRARRPAGPDAGGRRRRSGPARRSRSCPTRRSSTRPSSTRRRCSRACARWRS